MKLSVLGIWDFSGKALAGWLPGNLWTVQGPSREKKLNSTSPHGDL